MIARIHEIYGLVGLKYSAMKLSRAFRLVVGLLCLALLANCAVNPVTGRQNFVTMSESDEIRTGKQADADVRKEYGVYDNPALQRYVNDIGQRLARKSHRANLEYHFTIVDSPEINAFALPGGYIYITRGIMAYLSSEAELAAVLGHEIGHVTARHAVRQQSASMAAGIGIALGSILVPDLRSQGAQDLLNQFGNALISGYGRDHELEADRLGAEYLARAGYDPQAMVKVIGILKNQELFDAQIAREEGREPMHYHGLFATHPDNDTRLKEVVSEADRLAQPGADDHQAAYLAQINGLVFGDSPSQGIARGNRFLHGELGFALDFPPGWKIKNQPDKVVASSPGNDALIELQMAGPARGAPADFLRRNIRLDAGSELDTSPINGLPAAVISGTRQGKPIRAGAVYLKEKTFVLAATAKSPAIYNRYRESMSATITSFHVLQDTERKLAKPMLVRTRPAKKGETFANLALLTPLGKNADGYLRLMNHAYPTGELRPGQLLKTIE